MDRSGRNRYANAELYDLRSADIPEEDPVREPAEDERPYRERHRVEVRPPQGQQSSGASGSPRAELEADLFVPVSRTSSAADGDGNFRSRRLVQGNVPGANRSGGRQYRSREEALRNARRNSAPASAGPDRQSGRTGSSFYIPGNIPSQERSGRSWTEPSSLRPAADPDASRERPGRFRPEGDPVDPLEEDPESAAPENRPEYGLSRKELRERKRKEREKELRRAYLAIGGAAAALVLVLVIVIRIVTGVPSARKTQDGTGTAAETSAEPAAEEEADPGEQTAEEAADAEKGVQDDDGETAAPGEAQADAGSGNDEAAEGSGNNEAAAGSGNAEEAAEQAAEEDAEEQETAGSSDLKEEEETPEETDSEEEKDAEETAGAAARDDWKLVLVNAAHSLPDGFSVETTNLQNGQAVDSRCYQDLVDMLEDCVTAGGKPLVCSGFRTREYQTQLYEDQIREFIAEGMDPEEAEKEAGTAVAFPGTSEHELGLAVDICDVDHQLLNDEQADNPTQQWLMENCWYYGFILRYPRDKVEATGIMYEPWHYRYVGTEAAMQIRDQGLCLEEYLALE